MNVLILAAGYATRLQPLTLTTPKPLLPVAGRPMVDWVLSNLAPIPDIRRVFVVSNARFAENFNRWAADHRARQTPVDIKVLSDGSTDDTNKLGAIGDIHFVLEHEHLDDDLIVVAGDNLFSHSLAEFGRFVKGRTTPVLGIYDVGTLDQARKYGVVKVDATGRLEDFVEKPKDPPSTLIGIALYYYPKSVLPLIRQYIRDGNNPDQPGRLVQWLYPRVPFHTWRVPGLWYDIGSHDTLAEANRIFAAFVR